MRIHAALGALGLVFVAGSAQATDYYSARFAGAYMPGGDAAGWALSAGGAFEGNANPDKFGFRFGGDVLATRWTADAHDGSTFLLRPEIAMYFGGDLSALRPIVAVRPGFGFGTTALDARFAWTVEVGPEIEWRQVRSSEPRVRLGAYFAPASAPGGGTEVGRIALALTFEWGKSTLPGFDVDPNGACVPLPTRPCP